eukprot:TRINITY_DN813_c0_g1_i3.p1 TRINITY_DN813_c0_g1~~TRINITY_DN813_c0_g1_i3.p1  ORF type:complete len:1283 (+),score=283.05 TRINITY_DN813_c0_g1_i3:209-4057(+)
MASSDEEEETMPQSVSNYHFVDNKDEPISFSVLPIQWGETGSLDITKKQVFLHGFTDGGLQKIYKQVTAWKLDLLDEPVISVLSKDNDWIKLQKPRKSFEETIRTISITVQCLHFLKKNPEASEKDLWDHFRKVFSLFEVRPSVNDLLDHLPFISEMVKRDETLKRSKFLPTFLEKPKKRKTFDEDGQTGLDTKKSKFIVEDGEDSDNEIANADADESDEEPDLFDSVCAICDNGGDIVCCDGGCLRSFHATKVAGADSDCASLGYTKAQVDAMQIFLCKNCQYKQHQCYACGKLGSSDKSLGAEVFPCVSATCGRFYHPECVVKLLHSGNEDEGNEHKKKIESGESFTCPVHKCHVCKQGENKEVKELQFGICRRCPTAYHRKCLPREISFGASEDDDDDDDDEIIQRAWDDLIPNRILIYCLKHEIDEELATPSRDHLIFPGTAEKKKVRTLDLQSSKGKVLAKTNEVREDASREKTLGRKLEKVSTESAKKGEKSFSGQGSDPFKKYKTPDASKKPFKGSVKSAEENWVSVREKLTNAVLNKGSEPLKSKQKDLASRLQKSVSPTASMRKSTKSVPVLDSESEKKVLTLINNSLCSLTLDDIKKKHKLPSTHGYSSRNVDKTITQGKVEGCVEAVRAALQKLEEGGSIEDAKAVCEPEMLNQIIKWKNKLKVYLAPFLHGLRYTSFGRHFTKVDKLKEIVDKLHWYVQNGDMIVDFCCGANDFSRIMKEKLEQTGKRCLFKNYDLIQPKDDFNFEKRDFMTVRPKELPTGSQLIMGLNPPFGVKAALANKFIDKALEFKPKLLILIVPKETERLDEKEAAYDLLWEDATKLSGKSFYLPGSVDTNDRQMEQWNLKPPVLYLWSRPDWTTVNMAIAKKQGHLSKEEKDSVVEEIHNETQVLGQQMEAENRGSYADVSKKLNDIPQNNEAAQVSEEAGVVPSEEPKENSSHKYDAQIDQNRREDKNNHDDYENHGRNRRKRNRENSKEKQNKGKQSRSKSEIPSQGDEMFDKEKSHSNKTDNRSFLEGLVPSEKHETSPSERNGSEDFTRQFQPDILGSGSDFGTVYGRTQTTIPDEDLDDIVRRYGQNKEDPFVIGTQRWSVPTSSVGQDYRFRGGLDERFPTYINDNPPENLGRKSYVDELVEKFGRPGSDVRPQIQMYGRPGSDNWSQRTGSGSFLSGQDNTGLSNIASLSSPYARSGVTSDSSYDRVTSSAMQKYAPRLDEMNYARPAPFSTPETPLLGRSGILSAAPRVGYNPDMPGFAPGPPSSFPHHTSGWLNE